MHIFAYFVYSFRLTINVQSSFRSYIHFFYRELGELVLVPVGLGLTSTFHLFIFCFFSATRAAAIYTKDRGTVCSTLLFQHASFESMAGRRRNYPRSRNIREVKRKAARGTLH